MVIFSDYDLTKLSHYLVNGVIFYLISQLLCCPKNALTFMLKTFFHVSFRSFVIPTIIFCFRIATNVSPELAMNWMDIPLGFLTYYINIFLIKVKTCSHHMCSRIIFTLEFKLPILDNPPTLKTSESSSKTMFGLWYNRFISTLIFAAYIFRIKRKVMESS